MASYKCSEVVKEQIINAAAKLFLEKGYTQTTIRDICRDCGLSISRINYHFESKANLARSICRELFQNFYTELKKAIKNERTYSLVAEAITLRFIVSLLVSDDSQPRSSQFYKDCAVNGILSDVFNEGDRALFETYMKKDLSGNIQDISKKIGAYSCIFGYAFSAVDKCWNDILSRCDNDAAEAKKMLQDIYAGLFMQMMDIPHDVQKSMIEMSEAYYRCLDITLDGLTSVSVIVNELPSLKEKVDIISPYMRSSDIKLKSSSDRRSINIDTDKKP